VRDILSYGVDSHMGARVDLEELAMRALKYRLADGANAGDVAEADRIYLTDDYKRRVLEHMSIGQLIDTIMINPTVHLAPSSRDTGLVASYEFQPLSNLVYTRDQQITTCRGVVMARLRSPQRQLEVDLMRFALGKLGLPIIGAIEAPGFLEGGDYFAAGRSLAMVGIGLRSNIEACQQLMERDLLGTDRLAVVRDDFEQSQVSGLGGGEGGGRFATRKTKIKSTSPTLLYYQDRMHLDCCFSILGDSVCLMLDEMMGEDSPTRRLVDEYARSGPGAPYELKRSGVEFAAYMRSEGYTIIPVKAEDQLVSGERKKKGWREKKAPNKKHAHHSHTNTTLPINPQQLYGCNVLNLGNSKIISVHAGTARSIVKNPAFRGDVQVIDFGPVTSMYGAVHCASQVVKRTPRQWKQ
jgi:arginine deiminase